VSRYFNNFRREFNVTTSRSHKPTKTESLLVNLAESVGSTLGTLAAKADAAQKAIANSEITTKLEREGRRIVRKTKQVAGAATKAISHGKSTVRRGSNHAGKKVSPGKATAKRLMPRKTKRARSAVRRAVKRAKGASKRAASRK
jgi:hypothetical protein